MSFDSNVAIILLAAGGSTRMGQSKQLLPIYGKPLLLRSAEAAVAAGVDRCIVVLGDNESIHRKVIEHLHIEIIHHPDWRQGIGSSLKAGLRHALSTMVDLQAVLIMVCDQPHISDSHLKNVIEKSRTSKYQAIASTYEKTKGVPALFRRSLFDQLLNLAENQGARKILEHILVEEVNFPGGEIDLDTPEDYRGFIQ